MWGFVGAQLAMRDKIVIEAVKRMRFLAILFPFAKIDTTCEARTLFFAIF